MITFPTADVSDEPGKSTMKFFDFEEVAAEIARNSEDPSDMINARNIAMGQEFPRAVKEAGFFLLKPGSALDLSGIPRALVVGIEIWSPQDLSGIDSLANRIGVNSLPVYVFDLDEWFNSGELDRVLPGIIPRCTPVFVEYRDGRVVDAKERQEALIRMNQAPSLAS